MKAHEWTLAGEKLALWLACAADAGERRAGQEKRDGGHSDVAQWLDFSLLIEEIPLGRQSRPDTRIWHFEPNGNYTVKSGYKNLPGFHNNMGTSSSAALLHGGSSYGTYRSRQRLKSSSGNVFMISCQLTPIFVLDMWTVVLCVEDAKMVTSPPSMPWEGLLLANKSGLRVQCVETDCLQVANCVLRRDALAPEFPLIEDNIGLLGGLGGGSCCAISRLANAAAHALVRRSLTLNYERV
ncbi:hypothetical protein TIFTF001_025893 [Ficus carica]|uniref:RNase H type-1 domain-containing protein n=1 Tax=Ficus carica TaxID=3494 RepID=A0AA88DKN0_FICCA|nr:hypothetical protein TIFTF001_025893 [Ficus carica]